MQRFAVLLILLLFSACGAVRLPAASPPSASAEFRLWQDAAIFQPVKTLVGGARQRVLVEMYEFGRRDLATELEEAHARGADVRLIFDPSVKVSAATGALLARAGVEARPYPIDDHRHQIDHVKLLLTESAAVVGGMNWGAASSRNHDYAFELRRAADLVRLRAVFEQDWALAGGHPAPLTAAGPEESILQTGAQTEVRPALLALIRGARHEIAAEVFDLTDADVLAALAAAHRSGVRVRVLLDPNQSSNRGSYTVLKRAGVDVRWFPVHGSAKLHAKAGRFDRQLLVGSANWTYSGLSVNHELDVRTSEAAAVAAYATRFETDWAMS
ncbi:MAG TPA: phospholipase D-like domain-containing protein [Candidatus Dormibacteraeota bacterium]